MEKPREINLIPFDVMMKEKMVRRIWLWSVIIPLFLIVLAGIAFIGQMRVSSAEKTLAALSIKQQEIREKAARLRLFHEKRDQLLKKAGVINSLQHTKSLSLLFSELEKAMNRSVWLISFRFHDSGSSLKNAAKPDGKSKSPGETAGKDLKSKSRGAIAYLGGMANSNKDLAAFLQELSKSGYFSKVEMKYSQEGDYEGRDVVDFEIVAYQYST